MVTITNKELLEANGLEAIIKEDGEVVIQPIEVKMVNNGKWEPVPDKPFSTISEYGLDTEAKEFSRFDTNGDYEARRLHAGVVFPNKVMAERVALQIRQVIIDAWEEYEKVSIAMKGGNENEQGAD